jgi:hypothetical protein
MVGAGGGMTVALSDTLLLCDMLRPLPDFSDSLATAATTNAFYTRRKPLSATINTLANALYQVRSCSPLPDLRSCFPTVPMQHLALHHDVNYHQCEITVSNTSSPTSHIVAS